MPKKKLTKNKLLELIEEYLKRAKDGEEIPISPLYEEGIFRILGGINGNMTGCLLSGDRYEIEKDIVKGRFIDAIAYAVQQSGFYGWYGVKDGLIIKIDPKQLPKHKYLNSLVLANLESIV